MAWCRRAKRQGQMRVSDAVPRFAPRRLIETRDNREIRDVGTNPTLRRAATKRINTLELHGPLLYEFICQPPRVPWDAGRTTGRKAITRFLQLGEKPLALSLSLSRITGPLRGLVSKRFQRWMNPVRMVIYTLRFHGQTRTTWIHLV